MSKSHAELTQNVLDDMEGLANFPDPTVRGKHTFCAVECSPPWIALISRCRSILSCSACSSCYKNVHLLAFYRRVTRRGRHGMFSQDRFCSAMTLVSPAQLWSNVATSKIVLVQVAKGSDFPAQPLEAAATEIHATPGTLPLRMPSLLPRGPGPYHAGGSVNSPVFFQ